MSLATTKSLLIHTTIVAVLLASLQRPQTVLFGLVGTFLYLFYIMEKSNIKCQ